jgi:hypothetical protein
MDCRVEFFKMSLNPETNLELRRGSWTLCPLGSSQGVSLCRLKQTSNSIIGTPIIVSFKEFYILYSSES